MDFGTTTPDPEEKMTATTPFGQALAVTIGGGAR
jgi:hypothetical protein